MEYLRFLQFILNIVVYTLLMISFLRSKPKTYSKLKLCAVCVLFCILTIVPLNLVFKYLGSDTGTLFSITFCSLFAVSGLSIITTDHNSDNDN